MNCKFYLQSGYQGKEIGCLLTSLPRERLSFSAINKHVEGQIPVGSVEFVEEYIGIRKPNYYPEFLKDYFRRDIWESEYLPRESCFIKPADRHKRFNAIIIPAILAGPLLDENGEVIGGPFSCSEVIDNFIEEWRYYIANGEVLAAYWYQGSEEDVNAPELNIVWPKDFCGAVDFGRLNNGEIALVENNLPYACGWYGGYSDGAIYADWLEKGWRYLQKYS